jgi:hypothetical protein
LRRSCKSPSSPRGLGEGEVGAEMKGRRIDIAIERTCCGQLRTKQRHT